MKKFNLKDVALYFVAGAFGVAAIFAVSTANRSKNSADIEKPGFAGTLQNFDNGVLVEDAEVHTSENAPDFYQGQSSSLSLMPIDLTFTKSDVPQLMDALYNSKYEAVYLDNEICLRIAEDYSVQISKDGGALWTDYATERVDAKEFAGWLLQNDPNPGYSKEEMQVRLQNGAEVKYLTLENGNEIYIIIDENGVQIELVQPEKIAAVLLDGQRMMVTSEQLPILVSEQMLKSFYSLLASSNILTNTLAEEAFSEKISYFQEYSAIFTLAK